jgi:hypothetical protein
MKITQTRLKQIIQEELAAVQEAAGDGSGTGVSKEQRADQKRKAAIACNSKKGKQWDPTELTGPGLFSDKLKRACKDKVKEEVATVAEAESVYRAAGREYNRMAYDTPESIVNELNILAKAAAGMGLQRSSDDLLEVAYDIEQSVEIEQYSKPVEGELEEGVDGPDHEQTHRQRNQSGKKTCPDDEDGNPVEPYYNRYLGMVCP